MNTNSMPNIWGSNIITYLRVVGESLIEGPVKVIGDMILEGVFTGEDAIFNGTVVFANIPSAGGTPAESDDLTTKDYVDNAVTGATDNLLESENTWTGAKNTYNNEVVVKGKLDCNSDVDVGTDGSSFGFRVGQEAGGVPPYGGLRPMEVKVDGAGNRSFDVQTDTLNMQSEIEFTLVSDNLLLTTDMGAEGELQLLTQATTTADILFNATGSGNNNIISSATGAVATIDLNAIGGTTGDISLNATGIGTNNILIEATGAVGNVVINGTGTEGTVTLSATEAINFVGTTIEIPDSIINLGTGAFNIASGAVNIGTGGVNIEAGGLGIEAGGINITAGGATIEAGGVSVKAGDLNVVTGGVSVEAGDINVGAGAITVEAGDVQATGCSLIFCCAAIAGIGITEVTGGKFELNLPTGSKTTYTNGGHTWTIEPESATSSYLLFSGNMRFHGHIDMSQGSLGSDGPVSAQYTQNNGTIYLKGYNFDSGGGENDGKISLAVNYDCSVSRDLAVKYNIYNCENTGAIAAFSNIYAFNGVDFRATAGMKSNLATPMQPNYTPPTTPACYAPTISYNFPITAQDEDLIATIKYVETAMTSGVTFQSVYDNSGVGTQIRLDTTNGPLEMVSATAGGISFEIFDNGDEVTPTLTIAGDGDIVTEGSVTTDTVLASANNATVGVYTNLTSGTLSIGGSGSGDINIGSSGSGDINVGTSLGSGDVVIGSTNNNSSTTIRGGDGLFLTSLNTPTTPSVNTIYMGYDTVTNEVVAVDHDDSPLLTTDNTWAGTNTFTTDTTFDTRIIMDSVAIGNSSTSYAGDCSVAIGCYARQLATSNECVAIGDQAAQTSQGYRSVAIGFQAGMTQGQQSTAVGCAAASSGQGTQATAVGFQAGKTTQGDRSTALGYFSGQTTQGVNSTAVGYEAGRTSQGNNATAVGSQAGETSQGNNATAVGSLAGQTSQSNNSVAVGYYAGNANQGQNSTCVGSNAGFSGAKNNATAYGLFAGQYRLGVNSVAIGPFCQRNVANTDDTPDYITCVGYQCGETGGTSIGAYSLCLGYQAGKTSCTSGSVILSAGNAALNNSGTAGFFVKPVRQASAPTNYQALHLDTDTNEIIALPESDHGLLTSNNTWEGTNTFNGNVTFGPLITVSGLDSADVGLGNVTNESKTTMFTSPTFTSVPTAPTAVTGTNTTQLATTAFVQQEIAAFDHDITYNNNTWTGTNTFNNTVTMGASQQITFTDDVHIEGSANGRLCIGRQTDCTGNNQVSLGYRAGYNPGALSTAVNSVCIGSDAGANIPATMNGVNANTNVFIGASVASNITATDDRAYNIVAIGNQCLQNATVDSGITAIGTLAAQGFAGQYGTYIGYAAAQASGYTNGIRNVALGNEAAKNGLKDYTIAIGYQAGFSNTANSICLNASGSSFNSSLPGLFVNPVRNPAAPTNYKSLHLNTDTNEIIALNDSDQGLLSSNNTWTGTNTFDNDITVPDGNDITGTDTYNVVISISQPEESPGDGSNNTWAQVGSFTAYTTSPTTSLNIKAMLTVGHDGGVSDWYDVIDQYFEIRDASGVTVYFSDDYIPGPGTIATLITNYSTTPVEYFNPVWVPNNLACGLNPGTNYTIWQKASCQLATTAQKSSFICNWNNTTASETYIELTSPITNTFGTLTYNCIKNIAVTGVFLVDGQSLWPLNCSIKELNNNVTGQRYTSGTTDFDRVDTGYATAGTWGNRPRNDVDDDYLVYPNWGLVVFQHADYGGSVYLNFKNTTQAPVVVTPSSANGATSVKIYFKGVEVLRPKTLVSE